MHALRTTIIRLTECAVFMLMTLIQCALLLGDGRRYPDVRLIVPTPDYVVTPVRSTKVHNNVADANGLYMSLILYGLYVVL